MRACSQAGLVNNLNDAVAWGLAPLYLAAHGASTTPDRHRRGVYPAVWGVGQLLTGWLSDHTGRKPLIVAGMLVQAGALALLVVGDGAFAPALGAAILLGVGTALVYPTLDRGGLRRRPAGRTGAGSSASTASGATSVSSIGALLAGFVADAAGFGLAITISAGLTAASGIWIAFTHWTERDRSVDHRATRRTVDELLVAARARIEPRRAPTQAFEALHKGALIIDLRSSASRLEQGVVPGSIHIPRSVLEWRVDPDCDFRNPHACDLEREVILMCAHGYSSSFAALSLRELGFVRATDLIGGFSAWKAEGLPIRPAPEPAEADSLPGMGEPEPLAAAGELAGLDAPDNQKVRVVPNSG